MRVAAVLYDRGAVSGMEERTGADRGRFGPVVAYAMLAAATQLLWLTFAPITTASAHHYHTSETAIGWLAEIFPLLYLVLALPAGRLLDRSLHRWLAFGAGLTALGALVRLIGPHYGWALLGQVLVAAGQPFVLNAVTKVAAEHLPPERRPHGIAVGSAGIFAGMLLALVLGTVFGGAHLEALLVVQAVFAVLAATATIATLRRGGPRRRRRALARGRRGRAASGVGGPQRAACLRGCCSSVSARSSRCAPGCRRCCTTTACRRTPRGRCWSRWCSPAPSARPCCRRSS